METNDTDQTEELNLVEILKNAPEGTPLYSPMYGDCTLIEVFEKNKDYPISIKTVDGLQTAFTKDGKFYKPAKAECMLFPSKEQRDWNKFYPFVSVVYRWTWHVCINKSLHIKELKNHQEEL